jgi:hypothetical protein
VFDFRLGGAQFRLFSQPGSRSWSPTCSVLLLLGPFELILAQRWSNSRPVSVDHPLEVEPIWSPCIYQSHGDTQLSPRPLLVRRVFLPIPTSYLVQLVSLFRGSLQLIFHFRQALLPNSNSTLFSLLGSEQKHHASLWNPRIRLCSLQPNLSALLQIFALH